MKIKKFSFLALLLVGILSITACTTNDPNMNNNRNRNLSTQTRPNETRRNQNNNRRNTNDLSRDDINDNIDDLNPVDDGIRNDKSRSNRDTDDNLNDGMTRPKNSSSNKTNNFKDQSNNIAKKITDLSEVEKARVILTEETALVGCKLRGDTQGTMTTSLRQKIEDIVNNEANVDNISITTEPKLYSEIDDMFNRISDEHPIEEFSDDIRDLINKITLNINTNGNNR
ncbi:MAG TPA: YhcN/YlaJ family sporulation lipoprotein [Tissierellaceae bacterium]|nr:YhcN/YlaJ family sporulation lipoprotein [Tissierellaceae bacterium]